MIMVLWTSTVEPVWITEFWLSDMEVKTEKTSGSSKTHGEPLGELTDISNLEEIFSKIVN